MSQATISAALSARLNTLAGYQVQWENSPFTPPSGVYLAESFLPAATLAVGISNASSDEYSGIYQVSVMAPKGATKGPPRVAADAVLALFPRGLQLTRSGITVTILRASMGPAVIDGDRYAVTLSS
jgi:hypothetical protein